MKRHLAGRILDGKDGGVKKAVQTYVNMLWVQCVFAQFIDEHYLVEVCSAPSDMRMDLVNLLKPLRDLCVDAIVQSVAKGADTVIQVLSDTYLTPI